MFHVGQKVVCVDAAGRLGSQRPALVKGGVYTVTETGFWLGESYLLVAETRPSGSHCGFYADRFRPVVERKTDISIFTAMLNPKKESVDA